MLSDIGLVNVPNMVPEPRKVVVVSGKALGEHGGTLWSVVRVASVWAWQWAHMLDSVGVDWLVFSQEDLCRYGYHICLGFGHMKPLCIHFPYHHRCGYREPRAYSCQWVGVAVGTRAWQWELTITGVFPRGPPSLWVLYTFEFWACEAPVCIFSILSQTWVNGANSVQQSVSGHGRLLVHLGLVTVTIVSSYPNNNLTMASVLERKRTACEGWAT